MAAEPKHHGVVEQALLRHRELQLKSVLAREPHKGELNAWHLAFGARRGNLCALLVTPVLKVVNQTALTCVLFYWV